MKITKSELKEMIREALREELSKAKLKEATVTTATTAAVDWDYRGNWHRKTAPKEVYALMAEKSSPRSTGPVYIYFDLNGIDGYYEAAENLWDVDNLYSFYETATEAEEHAKAAYSQGVIAGWKGPINIVKITNFNDTYFKPSIAPIYSIVKTV